MDGFPSFVCRGLGTVSKKKIKQSLGYFLKRYIYFIDHLYCHWRRTQSRQGMYLFIFIKTRNREKEREREKTDSYYRIQS